MKIGDSTFPDVPCQSYWSGGQSGSLIQVKGFRI